MCLIRAHAMTRDTSCISGHIDKGDAFCEAIRTLLWPCRLDGNDYRALKEAVKSGRINPKKDYDKDSISIA